MKKENKIQKFPNKFYCDPTYIISANTLFLQVIWLTSFIFTVILHESCDLHAKFIIIIKYIVLGIPSV